MANEPTERDERRIYLRGVGLPLSLAEALIKDARTHGDGVSDALERALRAPADRRAKSWSPPAPSPKPVP
jgi:hypothetical protein